MMLARALSISLILIRLVGLMFVVLLLHCILGFRSHESASQGANDAVPAEFVAELMTADATCYGAHQPSLTGLTASRVRSAILGVLGIGTVRVTRRWRLVVGALLRELLRGILVIAVLLRILLILAVLLLLLLIVWRLAVLLIVFAAIRWLLTVLKAALLGWPILALRWATVWALLVVSVLLRRHGRMALLALWGLLAILVMLRILRLTILLLLLLALAILIVGVRHDVLGEVEPVRDGCDADG